jgi:hypothetical protein
VLDALKFEQAFNLLPSSVRPWVTLLPVKISGRLSEILPDTLSGMRRLTPDDRLCAYSYLALARES